MQLPGCFKPLATRLQLLISNPAGLLPAGNFEVLVLGPYSWITENALGKAGVSDWNRENETLERIAALCQMNVAEV